MTPEFKLTISSMFIGSIISSESCSNSLHNFPHSLSVDSESDFKNQSAVFKEELGASAEAFLASKRV